jgi:hypothetical protein
VLLVAVPWLIVGVCVSLLQATMIVRMVEHVEHVGSRTCRMYVLAGSSLRTLMTGGVLTMAMLGGASSGVAAGLGMLLGRWLFVLRAQGARDGTRGRAKR